MLRGGRCWNYSHAAISSLAPCIIPTRPIVSCRDNAAQKTLVNIVNLNQWKLKLKLQLVEYTTCQYSLYISVYEGGSFMKTYARTTIEMRHSDIIKWKHSALLALCERNPSITGRFPSQGPETRSYIFFDLRLNEWLSKKSIRRWFETPSHSLKRHCNELHTKRRGVFQLTRRQSTVRSRYNTINFL